MGHIAIDTLLLNRLAPTFQSNKGARNRFTMERHVMVLQGGHAAVHQLDPIRKEHAEAINGEGSDQNIAMSLLQAFTARELEAEKYYQWLDARTEGIVANPMRWFQVRILAKTLLEQEQLGARKVREIIKRAGDEWCEKNQDPVPSTQPFDEAQGPEPVEGKPGGEPVSE
jgi:hypothetical protein